MAGGDSHDPTAGILRVERRNVWQDLIMRYRIYIDDEQVGTMLAWQTKEYPVSPGTHQFQIRAGIGRSRSGLFPVSVAAGQTRVFRTCFRGPWIFDVSEAKPWIKLRLDDKDPLADPHRPAQTLGSNRDEVTVLTLASGQACASLETISFSLEKHGYDPTAVDEFLSKVNVALRRGGPSPFAAPWPTFGQSRYGYRRAEVDEYLALVAQEIKATGASGDDVGGTAQ